MDESGVPGVVIDQLRANLRAAQIGFTEADLAGMAAKGFLQRPLDFAAALEAIPADTVPDYLAAWGDMAALGDLLPAAGSLPVAPGGGDATRPDATAGPALRPGDPLPSLAAIGAQIARRAVSPVELVEQALARIAEHDPALNAFQLVLAAEARTAAQEAEQQIRAGAYRGPLHGVPVAVKDLVALRGTPTTAGSKILADWRPDYDAAVVEALRRAGAIIVGKTRLSEFAYSPGSNNAHYGPTPSPWNHQYDAGGSSSGSAAAVAAGLVFAALGTDTGGSIRLPAAQCGVVGLKPTFGRVSLYGVVPLSFSLDHIGPLTRTVADAALVLAALAGLDERDPRTRAPGLPPAANLEKGVRDLRVGVLHDDGSGKPLASPDVLAAWHRGLRALQNAGAELIEIDLPVLQALRAVGGSILAMEAAAFHEPWLRTRLDDYGPFMRQRILSAYAYGPNALARANQARRLIRRQCMAIFDHVDVLTLPTLPLSAPLLDTPAPTVHTAPFNALGWPAVSVPVGRDSANVPLAMQIAARPWDGATVLRAARVVEAAGLYQ